MPDITFPREFLTDALNVVDTLDADRQQLQQYNDHKKQLDKSLETMTRNIEREKAETVKSRRADIEEGFNNITILPYQILPPIIVLALLMLGFNFIGDGLREALAPKLEDM